MDPATPDTPETGRAARWRRMVAVDLGLLRRRRDFALLVASGGISSLGSFATFVAVPFQVYELTGSTLAVGLLGAAELVPILAMALVGGALADAFDRRRLAVLAEAGSALIAAGLLVNALLPDPQLWALFVGASALAGLDAIRRPPMDALVPRLVETEELKAASALDWSVHNVASIAGPALGGLMIAAVGLEAAYAVDVASFLLSIVALLAMRTPPNPEGAERPSVRGVLDGFRYARSRQELMGTYLVDMNAMFFAMPMALFPAMSKEYGGAAILGLMYAAPAVGSLVASLTSGWAEHVHRHGRAVVYGAAGWGVAMAAFGLADVLWLALLCLAVAGAMDTVSGIFRSTIWNTTIPDHLRGRLAGIEMISWSSGPLLGNTRAGAVAALAGVRASVVSGGVLCVLGSVALAAALPKFWNYDARFSSRSSRGDDTPARTASS